jgi:hypothetical protein
VGVFGFGSAALLGVGGALLADVEVRCRSKEVGGGLGPPVRSIAVLFIRGACDESVDIAKRARLGQLTILGALRLDGKVMLCLLLALSSSDLALTFAETSAAVCLIGPQVDKVIPPERSCDARFCRGATVGRDRDAIS